MLGFLWLPILAFLAHLLVDLVHKLDYHLKRRIGDCEEPDYYFLSSDGFLDSYLGSEKVHKKIVKHRNKIKFVRKNIFPWCNKIKSYLFHVGHFAKSAIYIVPVMHRVGQSQLFESFDLLRKHSEDGHSYLDYGLFKDVMKLLEIDHVNLKEIKKLCKHDEYYLTKYRFVLLVVRIKYHEFRNPESTYVDKCRTFHGFLQEKFCVYE